MDYIAKKGEVAPAVEGRIKRLNWAPTAIRPRPRSAHATPAP